MGEKTEKASPKKLRDAMKKGQVAKAQDLPAAFTFIASIWIVLGMTGYFYDIFGGMIISSFHQIPLGQLDKVVSGLLMEANQIILTSSLPVLMAVSIVGVIVNFVATGPVFAPEVFKFDIKKFDPVQNLKAKFKMKTLVELLKSLFKISMASLIIYDVMYSSLPVLIYTASLPMVSTLMIFQTFVVEVLSKVGLLFVVIAVADYTYQKKNFANEMKMEKFEVKQEYKNTEGDPQIKGKRRQIAQEIAYQGGPAGGIKRAQAIVVNPTHLAIAVGYDREVDPAPYIIAMGEDALAERIISIAKSSDIPIIRNIKLAHELWDNADVNEFVPENTYTAIAEILRWIAALQTDESFEYKEEE